jgi:hypothetical protein
MATTCTSYYLTANIGSSAGIATSGAILQAILLVSLRAVLRGYANADEVSCHSKTLILVVVKPFGLTHNLLDYTRRHVKYRQCTSVAASVKRTRYLLVRDGIQIYLRLVYHINIYQIIYKLIAYLGLNLAFGVVALVAGLVTKNQGL